MSDHQAIDDDMSADGPVPKGMSAIKRVLGRLFGSCASDPKGSVHRAWGISLLFLVLYFSVSIIESKSKMVTNESNQGYIRILQYSS
jgi:hypothetical protein